MVHHGTYRTFARSLEAVNERETRTQFVYEVSGKSFCWISKRTNHIQLFPSLGGPANRTRTIRRDDTMVLCVNCATGSVDAIYQDPNSILTDVWSYAGFRTSQCNTEYGFSLIRQAYNQAFQNQSGRRMPAKKAAAQNNTSVPDTRELIDLYNRLCEEHPHHLLPLETALSRELSCEERDIYRTVMVMILSGAMDDLRLTHSMNRFFDEYEDFRSLQGIGDQDVESVLRQFGIGRNKTGNGLRLRSLLRLRPWSKPFEMRDVATLGSGFGNKFRNVLLAYVFGNRNVFPLDTPAFYALQEIGFYKHLKVSQVDYVRADIEKKMRDIHEMVLIDLHELLRFRKQAGRMTKGEATRDQRDIILGWNGWRVLCSTNKNLMTIEWIERKLIKDPDLAAEFVLRFSGMI